MNAVKLYVGIVYENDKKIGFSYQCQALNGEKLFSDNFVVKKQGLENLFANIIKKILRQSHNNEPLYIGVYSDYQDIVTYMHRLIEDKHYNHVRQLKYQPRGQLFKILRSYIGLNLYCLPGLKMKYLNL